jgi:hypothetical protein
MHVVGGGQSKHGGCTPYFKFPRKYTRMFSFAMPVLEIGIGKSGQ